MAKSVLTIPATLTKFSSKPITNTKRKVAGYARVSTDHDEQNSSYEAQVSYYSDYIKQHDDWIFVDVFTDDGISGTHTAKRDGFNKMISEALSGNIDLIITKSVSRFARNTVDSLTTIRKLKEKGVECYFEKENIWTFDSKGEVLLTIMSSLAQEESRSISENILWGQRKRMADGKVTVAYSTFLGYDKGEDGNLVINPEQAKTVRFIFKSFLEGKAPYSIANMLIKLGYKTGTGGTSWNSESVVRILKNEKYSGNAILQKTYKADLLTKRKTNNGEVQKYFVTDSHEAIISKEEFDMVQQELESRKKSLRQHSSKSIFTDKIICGDCGKAFGSKVWHSTDKYRRIIWQCNAKFKNTEKCTTPHLTEDEIKEAFVKALNKFIVNKDNIVPDLQAIRNLLTDTTELQKQLSDAQVELEMASGLLNGYFNGNPVTEQDIASGKFEAIQNKYNIAKQKTDELSNKIDDRKNKSRQIKHFINRIEELDIIFDKFDENQWLGLADHMTVYSKDKITVTFKCGTEVAV